MPAMPPPRHRRRRVGETRARRRRNRAASAADVSSRPPPAMPSRSEPGRGPVPGTDVQECWHCYRTGRTWPPRPPAVLALKPRSHRRMSIGLMYQGCWRWKSGSNLKEALGGIGGLGGGVTAGADSQGARELLLNGLGFGGDLSDTWCRTPRRLPPAAAIPGRRLPERWQSSRAAAPAFCAASELPIPSSCAAAAATLQALLSESTSIAPTCSESADPHALDRPCVLA